MDCSFVSPHIISPMMDAMPAIRALLLHLDDQLAAPAPAALPRNHTKPEPFNLTRPRPRGVLMPEEVRHHHL